MAYGYNSEIPVSKQFMNRLILDIASGVYPPGSHFPSVRALAFEHSLNPNTVQKVMVLLEQRGLLITEGTSGRLVTTDYQVIEDARQELHSEYMRKMLDGARELGIHPNELIDFINKESEDKQ